jgi:hypothetical protein
VVSPWQLPVVVLRGVIEEDILAHLLDYSRWDFKNNCSTTNLTKKNWNNLNGEIKDQKIEKLKIYFMKFI